MARARTRFRTIEYFYFYPHIETGGLLVVDDIHIPTVHNLFRFLREEEMFQLVEEFLARRRSSRERPHPSLIAWADGW